MRGVRTGASLVEQMVDQTAEWRDAWMDDLKVAGMAAKWVGTTVYSWVDEKAALKEEWKAGWWAQ